MATLKSETGNDGFGFFWTGLYVIAGLWVGLMALHELAHLLGTELPISDSPWPRFAGRLFFGVIGFVALHLIGAALITFLETIGRYLLAGLARAIDAGERLGTALADFAISLLLALARLALVPVVLPWRIFQACVLAPWLERRRQMAELRGLYTDVKDQYSDFQDFLRAFNGESRDNANTQEDVRQDERADPAPADPFATACALFGLAADGSFTKAEFKAAYRTRMKEAHPDLAGDTAVAMKLNEARDLINARKGWKR